MSAPTGAPQPRCASPPASLYPPPSSHAFTIARAKWRHLDRDSSALAPASNPATTTRIPPQPCQSTGCSTYPSRTQYPIGQGCFHAGDIRWTDEVSGFPEDFHYVYDCGSSDGSAVLEDAIVAWRSQAHRLDALFVSHLDADHVNGIDRLLGSVTAQTVYIPYLDDAAVVLDIVEADIVGALSASLIEARMDPGSWFGRRGVASVVLVLSSPDEGPPGTEPDPVDDDDSGEEFEREPLLPPKSPFDSDGPSGSSGDGVARSTLEMMESGKWVEVNRSESIRWILVPHVDPAPRGHLGAFYREVLKVLGLQPPQRPTAERLAAALRDDRKRRRLRNCYDRIISGGSGRRHNRVSMSLYSGPADVGEDVQWWTSVPIAPYGPWPVWPLYTVPADYFESVQTAVGWIGTGDAPLKVGNVRTAWQRSFDPFRNQIATLLLPHHGSHGSFHTSLLDWPPNLNLCVVSAGGPSQYGHPHRRVVYEVFSRGKVMHHVSQYPQTVLREVLCLL